MVEGLLNRWCVKSDFAEGRTANEFGNFSNIVSSARTVRDGSTSQMFSVHKIPSLSVSFCASIKYMCFSSIIPYDAHPYHHLPTYNFSKN